MPRPSLARLLWLALAGALILAAVLTALAGQTYAEGVAVICAAPTASGATEVRGTPEANRRFAAYLDRELTNREALALWQRIAWSAGEEKAAILRRAVDETNQPGCEMLEQGERQQ